MNGWIELEQLAGFASELLVRFQQERVAVMEGNTQLPRLYAETDKKAVFLLMTGV